MARAQLWKNVQFLIKYESRRTGWGWFWTAIIFSCFALTAISLLNNIRADDSNFSRIFNRFVTDLFFMSIMGSLGFTFLSKDYRSSWWKRNTISKKLVLMRSLPITVVEIVLSRVAVLLMTLVIIGFCFFSVIYGLGQWGALPLSGTEYIRFVFIWLGYALACGGFYMYMEFALKEKVYVIWCFILVIGFILIAAGLQWVGINLVEGSMELAQHYGIAIPLISVLSGSLILAGCSWISVRKLERRELG